MNTTTGDKIQRLRRRDNITQEGLADYLEVSRQSVSKWESNGAYPETDKLIKMANLFHVSVDYLLRDNYQEETLKKQKPSIHYEYKSQKKLFGLPLIHINIGMGAYQAKGIIAIGMISKGLLSIGLLSIGILSMGTLSFGFIGIGGFSLSLIALAAIAIGVISIGAISIGLFAIGAISIGLFSLGALSIAQYVAIGDHAYGMIAVGMSKVGGQYTYLNTNGIVSNNVSIVNEIKLLINGNIPEIWNLFKSWISVFL